MLKYMLIICFCLTNTVYSQNRFNKMYYLYKWKQIEYDFNGTQFTEDTKKFWTRDTIYFEEDIEENEIFYTKYNNVPIGFEVYLPRRMVFITVPRRRFGIASTLNYVPMEVGAPLLKPYPNVDAVSSLVSVYRPRVDVCSRLWMVDTGLLEVPDNRRQIKQPEIIIFDLKSDTEILKYQLKPTDLVNGTTSGLTSITVDVTIVTCDDAYAYINDLATGGLIVFSLKQRDSWRFNHPSFTYDEGAQGFSIGNNQINWKDGIFSIALSDPDRNGIRTAYYHPFIATQEFSIRTDVLKNKNGDFESNYKLEGVRGTFSQSCSHAYDSGTRTLLFANVARDGILCWNIDKPLTAKNTALVSQSHTSLLYISDLKVDGGIVYVLANQMTKFIYQKLDPTVDNFLLYWIKVKDLVEDTVCDGSKGVSNNNRTLARFNLQFN